MSGSQKTVPRTYYRRNRCHSPPFATSHPLVRSWDDDEHLTPLNRFCYKFCEFLPEEQEQDQYLDRLRELIHETAKIQE